MKKKNDNAKEKIKKRKQLLKKKCFVKLVWIPLIV